MRTRNGHPVTILTENRNHPIYPVVGLIHYSHSDNVASWTKTGRYYSWSNGDIDLIPDPVEVSPTEMRIGQIGKFQGHTVVRTYDRLVDIENPVHTWNLNCLMKIELIENARLEVVTDD